MTKGEIVLIVFPFTDLSSTKLRPAVVLINSTFDLTVCFITSQLQWQESTDVQLSPNFDNGLKKQSLIRTSKIATLDKSMAKGLLGKLSQIEIGELANLTLFSTSKKWNYDISEGKSKSKNSFFKNSELSGKALALVHKNQYHLIE